MADHAKILLIRLKSIGDILHTLPAVHVVRDNFPGAHIAFLVSRENESLLAGFRDVNEVIALDRAPFLRKNLPGLVRETFSILRRLRRGRFSLVVDFQAYGETALLSFSTRARERWCDAYRRGSRWAYHRGWNPEGVMNFAERHLSLLKQCGLRLGTLRNDYVLPPDALADARQFRAAHELKESSPALYLQPLSSVAHKDWPLANYLVLARHWRERGVQVVFGGGPNDRAALEPVRQAGFPVSAGVPMLTTAGLMKLSSLVVGGDTGLVHLAVAMHTPVRMLMASAAPGKPHPFQHADWAITPADQRTVSLIETGVVIEACARSFAESGVRLAAS